MRCRFLLGIRKAACKVKRLDDLLKMAPERLAEVDNVRDVTLNLEAGEANITMRGGIL